MMKTALVTGDAGFVGRNLRRALEARNIEVHGVDTKYSIDCRAMFAGNRRFDYVFHCAAVVGGRMTIDREPLKVATDLSIDSDFFQYVVRTKPDRAVYFSSSAVYPVSMQTRGVEAWLSEELIIPNRPMLPDAIYGWVKLTGERIADYVNRMPEFASRGGVVHVFRPFSGYGGDQDLDYPFPSFIQRALRGDDPFSIWGDGHQTRDFVHISDVVEAVLTVLPASPNDIGPLNIGTGVPTSFRKLAQLVCEQIGYRPTFHFLHDNPVGVHWRVADTAKMDHFYSPKISIEDGVKQALKEGRQ